MTESFFNQDATHPASASMKTADDGYGQVSRWTREHFHETQVFPAPEDSTWFNAETQVDFITSWYKNYTTPTILTQYPSQHTTLV
jgi:hypothetical protein